MLSDQKAAIKKFYLILTYSLPKSEPRNAIISSTENLKYFDRNILLISHRIYDIFKISQKQYIVRGKN